MSFTKGRAIAVAALAAIVTFQYGHARAQIRRDVPSRPGEVFVGGYFYDTTYGPYPWWPQWYYESWYAPEFDVRAVVRLNVTPKDAAVYVDGFYAGVADDFGGSGGLPLPPGGHAVLLYRPGFQTKRYHVYLERGAVLPVSMALDPLALSELSAPPPRALLVQSPPVRASYRTPAPQWPGTRFDRARASIAHIPTGRLELQWHPAEATIRIDGELWLTSAPGSLATGLGAGRHHVLVTAPGYVATDTVLTIADGELWQSIVTLRPES